LALLKVLILFLCPTPSQNEGIRVFCSRGLVTHEECAPTLFYESLGVALNGRTHGHRVTAARFWKLRGAISGLLRRRRVSAAAVETIVGHCTFVALTRRSLLSCFNTVYKYITKFRDDVGVLWNSCREELSIFMSLMYFAESSWTRVWHPLVSETDASEQGWGWAESMWDLRDVRSVGMHSEKSRFRQDEDTQTGAREADLFLRRS